ncbi:MAG: hypothetical protein JEY97_00910 [Bacteroidales bacterium]|nr:hypothetical protein [Bacteroidales bacterium]
MTKEEPKSENAEEKTTPVNKTIIKVAEEKPDETEVKIEDILKVLYSLQQIDSQVDKIRIIRGELPLEVQDLEDEIVGLETRLANYNSDVEKYKTQTAEKENLKKECQTLIDKYEKQRNNVRNNREYDSLTKEIEFQSLEMQLCDKRIKEFSTALEKINIDIEVSQTNLDERKNDLELKTSELQDIVEETEKEENELLKKSEINQQSIESRLLIAYKRIRKNARNGLAVVMVERDACGGCFNKIPPQHQLDIRMHKKIIVCEYCGRILIDQGIADEVNESLLQ